MGFGRFVLPKPAHRTQRCREIAQVVRVYPEVKSERNTLICTYTGWQVEVNQPIAARSSASTEASHMIMMISQRPTEF